MRIWKALCQSPWRPFFLFFGLVPVACGPPIEGEAGQGGGPRRSDASGEAPAAGAFDAEDREDIRIVFVTHGQSADPFWSLVANGAQAAARDLRVRVEYQAPVSFDMVALANLIEAAVVSRPTGLVVSVPDPGALGPSIRSAVEAGIPVVSVNSGADSYRASVCSCISASRSTTPGWPPANAWARPARVALSV